MFTGRLAPVSNRATWIEQVELIDKETLDPVDLTSADVVVEVRNPETRNIQLSATTDNGKATLLDADDGIFQWTFSESEMNSLDAGTYEVGVTVLAEGVTTQILVGTVQVLDGVVSE